MAGSDHNRFNFSARSFPVIYFFLFFLFSIFSAKYTFAADIQAVLDTTDGSSGLIVQDSANAARMRVLSNGNVGINTVTPQGTLELIKSGTIVPVLISSSASAHGDYFTVTAAGNVGIGTAGPSSKLHVNTGTNQNLRVQPGTDFSASNGVGIQSINDANNTAQQLTLKASDVLVNVSGNVGIGTVVPAAKLDLEGGPLRIGNGTNNNASGINDAYITGNLEVDGSVWLGDAAADNLTIVGNLTQSTGNFNVTGGNIGIGTNTPQTNLAVEGAVGIGTWTTPAGIALDVIGTASMTGFKMTTNPSAGYILVSNSLGVGTWMAGNALPAGTAGGSSPQLQYNNGGAFNGVSGSGVDANGNIGIGTTTPQGSLTVTSGNVGIGTWAPNAALDLEGGSLRVGNGTNNNAAGVNDAYITGNLEVDGSVWLGDAAADNLTIVGNLTQSTGNFNVTGGNIGIGTNTPQTNLAVEGSVGIGTWTTQPGVALDILNGNVGIGTTTPQGSFIVTSGNVGIGTWAPNAKLDLEGGSLRVGNGTNNNASGINDAYITGNLEVDGSVWLGDAAADNLTIVGNLTQSTGNFNVTGGNIGIGTNTPQTNLAVEGSVGIGTWTSVNQLSIVGGAAIGSATYANTAAPVNGLLVSGNVGLGSLAPGAQLDVTGTARVTGFQLPTNASSGYILVSNSLGVGTWMAGSALPAGTAGGSPTQLQYNNGGAFNGVTNSAVTSSGNLGLGTTFSSNKLDISGGVGIGTAYAGYATAPANGLIVQGNVGVGTATPQGGFTVTNGNVGIGTWAPNAALDLEGGSLRVGNGTNNNAAGVNDAYITGNLEVDGSVWLGDAAADNLTIVGNLTQSTGNFNVTGGNIGIGTNTPQTNLAVEGSVGIGTWTTQPGVALDILNGNVGIGTTTPQGSFIVTSGNVGIGTWAPNAKLDLEGGSLRVGNGTNNNASGINDAYITGNLEVDGSVWLGDAAADNLTIVGNLTQSTGNFNVTGGNIGIGTNTPQTNLAVEGSVGIGTWTTQPGVALDILNGNVGIGSLTPGTVLDVVGTARVTGFQLPGNGAAAGNILVTNAAGIGTWMAASALPAGTAGGTPTQLQYNNGGAFNGVTGSGVDSNGNIGIGSTVPGQALDVSGNVRVRGTNASIFGDDNKASIAASAATAGDLKFLTNSAEIMRITNGGNVGIGTTTPQGGFTVTNGNVGIGTWAPIAKLDLEGGGLRVGNGTNNNATGVNDAYITGNLEVDGSVWLGDAAADNLTIVGNLTQSTGNFNVTGGNIGIGTNTPQTNLAVEGSVGIGTWTTQPGVALDILNGNVGIGSLTPGTILDVTGTTRTTGFQLPTNANSGYVLVTNSVGVGTWMNASALPAGTAGGSPTQLQYNNGGAFAGIANSNVSSAGNIGLGTTFSTNKLDINGGVGIGTAYAGYAAAPANGLIVQGNVGVGTSTPQGAFTVTNGNVGIGTWAPIAKLDLEGGGLRLGNGTNNNAAGVNDAYITGNLEVDGSVWLGDAAADNLTIVGNLTQSTGNFNVTGGNIGIGTSTPQTNLAVEGSVGIGTWTTQAGVALDVLGGNVGIGSLTPGTILDVTGTARVTGFQLSTSPTSGYVLVTNSVGVGTWMNASALPAGTAAGTSTQLQYNNGGAFAGITNSNVSTAGNIGLGTTFSTNKLDINGGVGIGTAYAGYSAAPANGMIVQGNIGVGSITPGTILDVTGTTRTTGFQLSTNPNAGYILVSNTVGVGTWMPGSALPAGTAGGNSGQLEYNNGGAFAGITNSNVTVSGNVGLGTILSANLLDINGGVGIGTAYAGYVAAPANGLIVQGNIGVGSTAPGTILDVTGTARVTGLQLSTNPVSGYVLVTNSVGVGTWMNASALPAGTAAGTSTQLQYNNNGAFAGITNSNVTTAGNVGLGTTFSANKLDINGGVGIGTAYAGYAAAPANGLIVQGNVGIGTSTPQGGFVVTRGNVGIGTWAPIAGLDLEGGGLRLGNGTNNNATGVNDAYITGNLEVDGSVWLGDAAADNLTIVGNLTQSTGNFNVTGGNIGIGTSTPQTNLAVEGSVGIGTWTTQPGVALDVLNGNVGIGSMTPGTVLDVVGTTRTTGFQLSTNPNAGYILVSNTVGVGTWMPGSALPAGTAGGNSGQLEYNSGGAFAGITNSNVTVSGNVGLGTILSANKLDINGGVGIGTAYAGYTAAPANGLLVQGNVGIGTTYNQAALAVMNGNVGIGTWAPNARLDLEGGGLRLGNGTNNNATGVNDAYITGNLEVDGSVWLGDAAADNLTIVGNLTQSTGNFNVTGGNIGIGTSTPQTNLAVEGSVGIGTWTTQAGVALDVLGGNVGIGSLTPGTVLDVTGTARVTGFQLSTSPTSGYVLVTNSVGVGTWMSASVLPAGSAGGSSTQVQYNNGGSLAGIANSNVTATGNLGLGTTFSTNKLDINGGVGIGTAYAGYSAAPANGMIVQGNIGVGSMTPGTILDVTGTTRTTGFQLSTNPNAGYILVSNTVGVGTWMPGSALPAGTAGGNSGQLEYNSGGAFAGITNSNVTVSGNVGLGTILSANKLDINGGVGIGTAYAGYAAAPANGLIVQGNIGVGTVTPGTILDVTGTARVTGFQLSTSPTSGYVLVTNSVGVGTWMNASALPAGTAAGTSTQLQYNNNGAFAGITNSNVSSAGNIGLGTTFSTNKLDINGGVGIGTAYAGYATAPANGLIVQGNVGVGTSTPQGGFTVTNGNVGIGTWAPNAALDLEGGSLRVGNGTNNNAAGVNDAYITGNLEVDGSVWLGDAAADNLTIVGNLTQSTGNFNVTGGNIGIGTNTPQTNLAVEGSVGIGTWTTQPGVALDVLNGNVGIGSMTPGTVLDVTGTARVTGFQLSTNPTSGYVLVSNSVGVGTWMSTSGLPAGSAAGNNGQLQYNNSGAFAGGVNTNVTTSGNVGLGTTFSANKLDINGGVGIGTAYAGYVAAPANGLLVQGNVGIGTTYNQAALAVMNGNVGIGTWAPNARLDLEGGGLRLGNGTNNNATGVNDAYITGNLEVDGSVWLGDAAADNLTIVGNLTQSTGNFNVTGGNIGIGTSTPQTNLAVEGSVGIGTWTTQPGVALDVLNGNVGIGSLTPGTILDVQGTTRTTGFQLSTSPTTGYVLVTNSVGVGTWMNASSLPAGSAGGSSTQVQYNNGGSLAGIANSNVTATGNLGLGTTFSTNKLDINGGVGIGTAYAGYATAPANGLIVQGNIGVGSVTPGTILDVTGTTRMTGFVLNNSPVSGDILMTNSVGVGTWVPASAVATTTVPGGSSTQLQFNNGGVFGGVTNTNITATGNIGLGTTLSANILDINGGVGIGTAYAGYAAAPANGLLVQGNVGIGTTYNQAALAVMNGNVGIGTWAPNARLDLEGGGLRLGNGTNNNATGVNDAYITGNLEVDGSVWLGDAAADNLTIVGNLTQSTGNFNVTGGNIGIGTNTPQTNLAVEGSVGIGTWTTQAGVALDVLGGNVGIGSMTPGTVLDVTGTARVTGFQLSTNPTSGYVLVTNSVGVGTWMSTSGLPAGSAAGNNGQLQYNNSGAFAGGVNTNVTTSGNVGLGTTFSANKLDINGGVGIGTAYAGYTAAPANGLIVQGNVGIGSTAPGQALDINGVIRTTGSGASTFSSNVGIGSLVPGTILDVTGTARVTGFQLTTNAVSGDILMTNSVGVGTWVPASAVATTTVPGGSSTQIQYNNGGVFGGVANTNITASGNIGLGTTLSANILDIKGGVGIGTAYAGYTAAPANGLLVQGNVGIGTTYNQAALAVMNGNVGIGTWAPNARLDLEGGGLRLGNGTNNNATGVNDAYITGNLEVDGSVWLGDAAADNLTIVGNLTQSTGNFNVTGGNIGIGTSTPQTNLAVEGSVGIGTWTTQPGVALDVLNGNVGIGSMTPGTILDVQGTTRTTGFQLSTSPTNGYVLVTNSVGVGTWMAATTLPGTGTSPGGGQAAIQYNSASTFSGDATKFAFDGTNVGIGTSGPLNRLAVSGNIGVGTISYSSFLTTAAPSGGMILEGNVGLGTTTPQTKLAIMGGNVGIGTWTAAGGNLIINGGGNVGIGTAWPGATLDVNGSIRTSGSAANSTLNATGGNVGIGSLAPGATLDVTGTARMTGFVLNNSPVSGDILMTNSVGVGTWVPASAVATTTVPGGSSTQIQYNNGGAFGGVANTNITASGNIGLGTTLSANILDIKGGVGIGTAYAGYAAAPANGLLVQGNVGIGTTYNQAALAVMNGNVGIGTWAPNARLDLEGGGLRLGNGTNNNATGVNDAYITGNLEVDGSVWLGDAAADNLTIVGNLTQSTGNFNVTGGNIGIGTSTPQTNLAVEGSVGIGTWTTQPGVALDILNGNVGIGSLTPGTVLDVVGTTRTTGFQLSTTPTSGYVLVTNSVGVGTWMNAGSLPAGTAGGTSTQLQYNNGGSFAGITNSSVTASGNVGLGTTFSANKLDINGGVGIGTAYAGYTTAPANGLIVQGNIGVGTVTPGTILDVTGTARVTGFQLSTTPTTGYVLVTNSTGIGTWMNAATLPVTSTPGGSSTQIQYNNSGAFGGVTNTNITASGNIGLGTTFSTNKLDINGGVGIGTAYAGYTAAPANGLIVQGNVGIGSAAPGQALDISGAIRLTGSGASTFSSNVGIGSLIPGTILDVQGTTRTTGFQLSTSPTTGYVLVTNSVGVGTWMNASTLSVTSTPGGSSTQIQYNNGGVFGGVTNTNITASGNIGLGTTLSANTLDIKGGVGIGTAYAGYTAAPANGLLVQGNVGIGTTYNQAALAVMNGNVGIGTWAPNARLDLEGGGLRLGNGTNNNATGVNDAYITGNLEVDGSVWLGDAAADNLTIVGNLTQSTGNFNVTGGNIGIGTNTPQTNLAVEGSVGIGTWTTQAGVALDVLGGNVGIGSLTPGTVLDVVGTTRTTGFQLSTSPTTGYVLVTNSVGVGTWMNASSLPAGSAGGTSTQLQYNNNGSLGGIVNSNVSATGNIGLGTTLSINKLDINGGVGIGTAYAGYTAAPANGLIVQGNVGIGSTAPGQTLDINGAIRSTGSGASTFSTNVGIGTVTPGTILDVTGTARVTGFQLSTSPTTGYVLVTNSVGVGTWMNASTLSVTSIPGGSSTQLQYNNGGAFAGVANTNITSSGNIGLGTTFSTNKLDINGGVGIGTAYAGYSSAPANGLIVQGNIGVGTVTPGAILDVTGTARVTGFQLSTSPTSGYVMVTNSVGVGTWVAPGTIPASAAAAGSTPQLQYNSAGVLAAITSGGTNGTNIGIGTVSFSNRLNILGNVGISTLSNSPYLNNTLASPGAMTVEGNIGIGTFLPASSLDIEGSLSLKVISQSGDYTATAGDHIIIVDASGGAKTITLPAAAGVPGRVYQVKKKDSSVNIVTVAGSGAELIDAANTITISAQYQSLTVVCDGAQWWVI